jgi:hypothetical protein
MLFGSEESSLEAQMVILIGLLKKRLLFKVSLKENESFT